ncbi:MAG: hypothetical protein MUC83_14430 [Pirellula sp.]|jgi:hypothetical protein|nr:hypothetical protein [Pirellula sp.]
MSSQIIYQTLPWSWVQDCSLLCEIYRIQGYDVERITWGQIGVYILGVFMILLAAWQGILAAMRWAKKPSHSPSKLLSNLIRSHHLSRSESKLVEQIAKQLPDSIPATALFIDPNLWDNVVLTKHASDALDLKRKLFGG